MKNYQTSMDILREERRREGREQEHERIIIEMIRKGTDVDTISEIPQLDPQRILELRRKVIP